MSSSSHRPEQSAASGVLPAATGVEVTPGKIALYSLILYKWSPEQPVLLSATLDLSSFPYFHRHTIKEHILFHSRLICSRTPLGMRQVVEFQEKIGHCHVYVHPSGLAGTVLSTAAYPMRVAFGLLTEALRKFQTKYMGEWEGLKEDRKEGALFAEEGRDLLQFYQSPVEADRILKVQRGLDEVKDVMLKNIDDLLQRGEKLEDLMKRSEDLSNTSYQFYRQAKKNNSCCTWY